MELDDFVAYVGPAKLHGSTIVAVQPVAGRVTVTLSTEGGCPFALEFVGVQGLSVNRPEGARVHVLSELRAPSSTRRFVLSSSAEPQDWALDIVAESFREIPASQLD